MKTALVNLRVPQETRDVLKKAAATARESLSQFLLKGALLRIQTGATPASPQDPFVAAWDRAIKSGAVSKLSRDDKTFVTKLQRAEKQGKTQRVALKDGLRRIKQGLKKS